MCVWTIPPCKQALSGSRQLNKAAGFGTNLFYATIKFVFDATIGLRVRCTRPNVSKRAKGKAWLQGVAEHTIRMIIIV